MGERPAEGTDRGGEGRVGHGKANVETSLQRGWFEFPNRLRC